MYRFLGGYVLFLQFLWLLFLSLVCRNVVLVPQPGTTLLQYIHWLCTQVMAMLTDDVMIGCFFWIFISTWLLGHWDMDAAGRIILVNSGVFSVKIFYSWTLETGTMESHTYKQRGFALEALLEKAGFSFFSSFLSRFRFMLLEVFKCLKKINPKCTNNLFEVKQHDHCLRDGTRLLQPKVRTTTPGLRTISYLGAKLWNDLPVHMKNIHPMDPYEFESMFLLWEGRDLFSTYQCYMWYVK